MFRVLSAIAFVFTTLFSLELHAGVRVINGTTDLSIADTLVCAGGMSCSKLNGTVRLTTSGSGSVRPRVAATATTLTLAQCGSTFYNTGAVVVKLPLAASVLGCHYRFVTLNASNFDVNPDDTDQIMVTTDAVGDAIRNATIGNSVTLEACAANKWCSIGGNGTYTDVN